MAILSFLKPYCLIECVRLSQPKRSLCISLLDSSCCDARAYGERGHKKKKQLQKNEYIKLFLVSCDQILIWKVFLFRVLKRVELSYNMVVHIQCGSTLQVLKVLFIHTSFSTGGSTCVFFNLALLLFFFFFPLAPILLLFVSHSFRSTSPTSWRRALIPITTATVTSPRSSNRTTLTSRREMSPSRGQLHTGRTGAPRVAFHNRFVCYPFRSSVLLALKKIKWSNSPMTIMRVSGFENG